MLAELQNISKTYEQAGQASRNEVLKLISLRVFDGDSIAITGPSGSGKSTLLNILGTLDRPTSGEVILNGVPAVTLNEKGLAAIRNRLIGFVFQMHHLMPQLTLLENALLPALPLKDKAQRSLAVERAHHLLDRVGLRERLHQLPARVSAGECQRAALVRALINQPRLLLADEPTGSLDSENAHRLGELLAELKQENNLAMVIVTHSAELAARMEKTYRLTAGELQPMQTV